MASWFEITYTGDPTDADRERAAELVAQGFTSGQLLGEPDADTPVEAGPSPVPAVGRHRMAGS